MRLLRNCLRPQTQSPFSIQNLKSVPGDQYLDPLHLSLSRRPCWPRKCVDVHHLNPKCQPELSCSTSLISFQRRCRKVVLAKQANQAKHFMGLEFIVEICSHYTDPAEQSWSDSVQLGILLIKWRVPVLCKDCEHLPQSSCWDARPFWETQPQLVSMMANDG